MSDPGMSSSSWTMVEITSEEATSLGGLAAHAVGDREQPWPGITRVLVVLADHAVV